VFSEPISTRLIVEMDVPALIVSAVSAADPLAYQPDDPAMVPLTQVPPRSATPSVPEVVLVKESVTAAVNHCFQLVLSFKLFTLIHALVAEDQVDGPVLT
jgi:hypothetical protein